MTTIQVKDTIDKDALQVYLGAKRTIGNAQTRNTYYKEACVIQNISDSKHDHLDYNAAKRTMPQINGLNNPQPLAEDDFIKEYLKGGDNILKHYTYYQDVILLNGEESNVDTIGERKYPNKNSVIETILEMEDIPHQNIYISKDFGFPAVKYDFTYFKNKDVYVGYLPSQENDAAGKPTMKNPYISFKSGFLSKNIKTNFIWTDPEIDPNKTILQSYSDPGQDPDIVSEFVSNPSRLWTCAFESYIGWNPDVSSEYAHDLKSQTIFRKKSVDGKEDIIYHSDSSWTSKSGKDLNKYNLFNRGAMDIFKRTPLTLGSPFSFVNNYIKLTENDFKKARRRA